MADPNMRTLGPGSLTIGNTEGNKKDFSADVTNVALEPSTDTEDPDNYLDGHQEAGAQTDTWTLTGTIKDLYSSESVSVWCMNNSGKTLPFEFIPNKQGSVKLTGNVTISPVKIGGDVKSRNANDFSFTAADVTATRTANAPAGEEA